MNDFNAMLALIPLAAMAAGVLGMYVVHWLAVKVAEWSVDFFDK